MKKKIVLSLIVLSGVTLVACGNSEEKTEKSSADKPQSSVSKNSTSKTSETKEEKKEETSGDFVKFAKDATFDGKMLKGNTYSVKITSNKVIQPGEVGNEYGDKPVLAFWYDTLVSPEYNESPAINPNTAWLMNFTAVQDNDPNKVNKLKVTSLPDTQFLDSQMAEIKPGGTVPNAVAYELSDNETPVTLTAGSIVGKEYGKADFPVK
ncbi:DUF5067 domain-containing protein [Enterococcus quebecensis]|uniref:DUF5067 domain-containing protein n=1 Tax=Enterococcus quebecensis TaxID=903983 RepID=A0A1E5H1I1_9ENTE|nr:DUF5067 domain-containing protein [Enterococcus quebecensis]OEG18878.1 DUF5067 domain-containing protein [Enterococcus quebecensis]OJG71303.1 hypothetical protein RV12_GL001565 [Enterococcus quebecensis]